MAGHTEGKAGRARSAGGGAPGGVRRRQGVRRPVNIGRNSLFAGVSQASGTARGPSGDYPEKLHEVSGFLNGETLEQTIGHQRDLLRCGALDCGKGNAFFHTAGHAKDEFLFAATPNVAGVELVGGFDGDGRELRVDDFGWMENLIQQLDPVVFASGLGEIGTKLGAFAADAMAGMALRAAFLKEDLAATRRITFQSENGLRIDLQT